MHDLSDRDGIEIHYLGPGVECLNGKWAKKQLQSRQTEVRYEVDTWTPSHEIFGKQMWGFVYALAALLMLFKIKTITVSYSGNRIQ